MVFGLAVTTAQFNEIIRRNPSIQARNHQADRVPPHPIPQPLVRHESLATHQVKERDPRRYKVSIISFRSRLTDIDNLYGGAKFQIDALRYCGLIPDDSAKHIVLEIKQEKVPHKVYERTDIIIEPI